MRCTDCIYAKETIPEQLHYIYCANYDKEMSVAPEFETCQYEETELLNIKLAVLDYCSDANNHIIAVDELDMLNALANKFNIPNFMQNIVARRKFETEVFKCLKDSKVKLETASLITDLGDGGESRESLLILRKPK